MLCFQAQPKAYLLQCDLFHAWKELKIPTLALDNEIRKRCKAQDLNPTCTLSLEREQWFLLNDGIVCVILKQLLSEIDT